MNDIQRALINSFLALREVHAKAVNRALWSSLAAYTLLYDRFLAKLAYINACLLIQSTDTKGITLAKKTHAPNSSKLSSKLPDSSPPTASSPTTTMCKTGATST